MATARKVTVHVPKLAEWNKAFRAKGGSIKLPRCTLANAEGAALALTKLNIKNPQDTTVVELYPGLGVWTAALVNANFKRIITLEPHTQYFNKIEDLAKDSQGIVEAWKKDGYDWEAYVELKKPEYLGKLVNTDWTNAQWDVFEYVLKHLFVMQKQPLSKMIKTLGPGADIILGRLSFDPKIAIGQMTAKQIDEVAVKFDQWPLRPRVLFEDASLLCDN
ncbi:hypothetical protein DFQ29_003457 [Apophysomyces sp. BC1021]|nr:hypothetical protein DFQ29_003457 [Apophysomyces sp. BC1021]